MSTNAARVSCLLSSRVRGVSSVFALHLVVLIDADSLFFRREAEMKQRGKCDQRTEDERRALAPRGHARSWTSPRAVVEDVRVSLRTVIYAEP